MLICYQVCPNTFCISFGAINTSNFEVPDKDEAELTRSFVVAGPVLLHSLAQPLDHAHAGAASSAYDKPAPFAKTARWRHTSLHANQNIGYSCTYP